MNSFVIRPFDPNRITELAKIQTQINNEAIKDFPDYLPATVDDVIARFQRKEFDPKRMFYAYEGSKIVGYAGLSGRNLKDNLRTVGYPWILKGISSSVRDLLYKAMENQCRREGTKNLQVYVSEKYPDIIDFFTSKDFKKTQEYVIMEKI